MTSARSSPDVHELDVRQENWAEAHRLWGELVGDTELSQLAAPPLRAIPTTRDKPVRVTPAESGELFAPAAGSWERGQAYRADLCDGIGPRSVSG